MTKNGTIDLYVFGLQNTEEQSGYGLAIVGPPKWREAKWLNNPGHGLIREEEQSAYITCATPRIRI